MNTQNIERLYGVIQSSLFTINGSLSYDRIIDATRRLCDEINSHFDSDHATDDGYEVWDIGEFTECHLSDYLVGAYWHLTEWHGGQWSDTYAAMCAVGSIYSPGMGDIDSEGETAKYAYNMLNEMAEKKAA